MKFCINTDNDSYGSPRFFKSILERQGMIGGDDVVLNLCSIHNNKIKKGKKCTIYVEGDEFLHKGCNKQFYDDTDLLYIGTEKYLGVYPAKTKILKGGFDSEYHYPRNVEKKYDYVFVGRFGDNEGTDVYGHRNDVLRDLRTRSSNILLTNGTPETYCEDMSSGRIILNVLPRRGDDACLNMRVIEGMAIGTLMTDDDDAFKGFGLIKNVHYLPLERFGENFTDEELENIHKAGRKQIEQYSYQNAIKQIIKDYENFISNQ